MADRRPSTEPEKLQVQQQQQLNCTTAREISVVGSNAKCASLREQQTEARRQETGFNIEKYSVRTADNRYRSSITGTGIGIELSKLSSAPDSPSQHVDENLPLSPPYAAGLPALINAERLLHVQ
ncbi:uncharacterized protein UV8b_07246 [Ustilaginoidea virens]|uniref:Uncharacterized protein n=1 Tax=Ustilaginoidea virens TaxID=1159556 RepID=A0A8E5HWP4_USTVR|nr:uncharacterized protein UV8b_07246 [Ustilaginoidea virens]QUC23005.1 hypothetical protein UV8b_07246 [Ustilaginoidea virens]